MVVATFALDWLDDDGRNLLSLLPKNLANLLFRHFFSLDNCRQSLRRMQREVKARRRDAGPGKFREKVRLTRIRIRQAQSVTGPSVKRAFEVNDFRADFASAGSQVLAHLPIHGGLQRIL